MTVREIARADDGRAELARRSRRAGRSTSRRPCAPARARRAAPRCPAGCSVPVCGNADDQRRVAARGPRASRVIRRNARQSATAGAASISAPERTSVDRRLDVRVEVAVVVEVRDLVAQQLRAPLQRRAGRQRRVEVAALRRRQQLDAEHAQSRSRPSAAAAARRAPPSRRGPPGWPRSGWNRRSPDRPAACSPRPAPRPSPAGS